MSGEAWGALEQARLQAQPRLPHLLQQLHQLVLQQGASTESVADSAELRQLFPHVFGQPEVTFQVGEQQTSKPIRVGVVLSGGQAPGGHNVIAGLFDALKQLHPDSKLVGFLGGPGGIVSNTSREITSQMIDCYRNLGGFDIIGSGRTKIETEEQLKASAQTCQTEQLDGVVVIGGDDSNTNAAVLANYFQAAGCATRVIGVPKTIDGDLKNEHIPISFGHHTACRVYSELIGNLMRDALSARKYYHFIKLMGRSASHIALECALTTHPNVTLIGEEVAAKGLTLRQVTDAICDVIIARAAAGKDFGIVLVPEGLIEFIPEIGQLISELNTQLADSTHVQKADQCRNGAERVAYLLPHLSQASQACLNSLPEGIQTQLLLDRDPHGNVQVSRIETERLLIATVEQVLKERAGYQGRFNAVHHFFGYEGRSAMPSQFDCHYCYALGYTAALLVQAGLTGYMSTVQRLTSPVEEWTVGGTPLTMMMNLEERKGKRKPVIQKALVQLDGPVFKQLQQHRQQWVIEDHYGYPGPQQFFGPEAITEELPISLVLESSCPVT